jgi:peroxiredoxin
MFQGDFVMKSALTLLSVVALIAVGCAKSEPKTGVASSSPAKPAASPADASATQNETIKDTEVQQTAATIESPAEKSQPAGIGAAAPAWQNLEGADGKQQSLKDLADAKAVAVIFTCNTCPVAVAYEDRMIKLANDYKDKGVTLVAINVNKDDANSLPAMKQRAEEKGFTFAYLFDPSQQIARDYGATVTPHAYLLNGERKIVYMGAIDDNQNEGAVTKHHLREAIDAVLAGQNPAVAETKQFGCGIKYE